MKREKKRKRKKKKRRRGREDQEVWMLAFGMELWIFGMETEFMYGFYEIMYEFPCFDGYPLAQI